VVAFVIITIYCPVVLIADPVITPGMVPEATDEPDETFVIGDMTLYKEVFVRPVNIGTNSPYSNAPTFIGHRVCPITLK
jgi:hypothetical protein